jgi:uncharacterized protein YecE (DUF72 family)
MADWGRLFHQPVKAEDRRRVAQPHLQARRSWTQTLTDQAGPPVPRSPEQDDPHPLTSPLAVVRFHGHNAETYEKPNISAAERFRYLYTEEELKGWVAPIRRLAEEADQVHVLMNNCYGDYGVRNARQLAELLAAG